MLPLHMCANSCSEQTFASLSVNMRSLCAVCIVVIMLSLLSRGQEQQAQDRGDQIKAQYQRQYKPKPTLSQQLQDSADQYASPSLISFDAVGKHVALGLDYLVPFMEVPVKRKRNAPPKPLVVVNSAAIFSCGIVALGGILVGHLIRSLGLEAQDFENGGGSSGSARSAHYRALPGATAPDFMRIFEYFKLIHRNDSGARTETTLPQLFGTIEQTFLENDIDLAACLQKSICTMVHNAGEHVRQQRATDFERLIDGATSWSWLMSWLQETALHEAIDVGKTEARVYCDLQYPACKWAAPEQNLWELLNTNVRFA